jgi:hypothetical protein
VLEEGQRRNIINPVLVVDFRGGQKLLVLHMDFDWKKYLNYAVFGLITAVTMSVISSGI